MGELANGMAEMRKGAVHGGRKKESCRRQVAGVAGLSPGHSGSQSTATGRSLHGMPTVGDCHCLPFCLLMGHTLGRMEMLEIDERERIFPGHHLPVSLLTVTREMDECHHHAEGRPVTVERERSQAVREQRGLPSACLSPHCLPGRLRRNGHCPTHQ